MVLDKQAMYLNILFILLFRTVIVKGGDLPDSSDAVDIFFDGKLTPNLILEECQNQIPVFMCVFERIMLIAVSTIFIYCR